MTPVRLECTVPRSPVKHSTTEPLCSHIYIYTASVIINISASWTSFFGDVSVAQLVALMSGVVLGGVAEVVGSNLARGKIFTASIGSVDSLYPSVFTYCLNLHQFLILCSSKAMMFVKLYFRNSDLYLISLVSLDPSGFHLRNDIDAIHWKRTNIRRVLHQSSSISAFPEHPFLGMSQWRSW